MAEDEEVVAPKRQKLEGGHDGQNGNAASMKLQSIVGSVEEDSDNDDDKPLCFKRRETAPLKQKAVNHSVASSLKRPSSDSNAKPVKPSSVGSGQPVKKISSVSARPAQDDRSLHALASTSKSTGIKSGSPLKPPVKSTFLNSSLPGVLKPGTEISKSLSGLKSSSTSQINSKSSGPKLSQSSASVHRANHSGTTEGQGALKPSSSASPNSQPSPPGSKSVGAILSSLGAKSNLSKSKVVAKVSSSSKVGVPASKASTSDAGRPKNEDDSDDDVPLASRLPISVKAKVIKQAMDTKSAKGITSAANSVLDRKQASKNNDSDDDKPLAYRTQEIMEAKPMDDDSEDDKPLAERKPMKTYVRKDSLHKGPAQGGTKRSAEAYPSSPGAPPEKKLKVNITLSSAVKSEAKKVDSDGDDDDDEDDVPLAQRKPATTFIKKTVTVQQKAKASSSSGGTANAAKKFLQSRKAKTLQVKKLLKKKKVMQVKTTSKKEPGSGEGVKWQTLEHNGVIFPPPYEPHGVKMLYDGKPVDLTPDQEEIATMFAVMKDSDYATKPKFIKNFWEDWEPYLGRNHVIKKLDLCDFTPIYDWHQNAKETKKKMSSEEKKRLKEEKLKAEDKYMWALVDGVKEKVGNFRVEPPGLFRGRGDHPKMGKLKTRIMPRDIVINIGKDASVPDCPMPGHKWKEVRHDNTVTWLAYWNDPINNKEFKYVFLAASSNLKGQSDMQKYEKSRVLKDYIDDIRRTYTIGFASSDSTERQIAVATYLIDRLALRAGNEKDEDEADTVGCCSLKVEHVTLVAPKSLEFDFLGKDSIRYFNTVEVDERVYKAIGQFKKGKVNGDDLFEKLDTSKLNLHLKGIMPALTAKVFRTYNASITLDSLLQETSGDTIIDKIADYQRANKEVAILCNHQRSVSKGHGAQMERLEGKMAEMEGLLEELETDLDRAKRGKPPLQDADGKVKKNQNPESLEKKVSSTRQKIEKMRLDMRIKDDLKSVALGTSKINYMDPRITVAWCKRHEVPIEKIFNKSLLAKFAWAMEVEPDFRF